MRVDGEFVEASKRAEELPSAASLTNANFRCGDLVEESEDDLEDSFHPACSSPGCLDGDLGVYCQCYEPKLAGTQEVMPHTTTNMTSLLHRCLFFRG